MIIDQNKLYSFLKDHIGCFLKSANKSAIVLDTSNSAFSPFHLLADKIGDHLPFKIWSADQGSVHSIAEEKNAIIIGQLSYEEVFFRLYPKNYRADFLPLGNLFQSELIFNNLELLPCSLFTWEKLEWACRENIRNEILTKPEPPSAQINWAGYTGPQKELIGKLWARRQITEHKKSFLPCPVVGRPSTELVR